MKNGKKAQLQKGPYKYSPKIDDLIVKAVEAVLNLKVNKSSKIPKGEVNHVYRLDADGQTVVARVFRHPHWPENGKLEWVEQQLTANQVPHATQIYYSRNDRYFPYGFMVSRFIEGKNGFDAIEDKDVTFEEFHEKLARLLSKIHQIKTKGYGLVNLGKGQHKDYIEHELQHIRGIFSKLEDLPDFNSMMFRKIEAALIKKLNPYKDKFKPVLIHGDPTPDNCIWTKDGQVILVDWNGAKSNLWLADYAWITYWGSHLTKVGGLKKRKKILSEVFTKAYGGVDFNSSSIKDLESALHILQAIDLLPYYYFDQQNIDAYNETKEKLNLLIS